MIPTTIDALVTELTQGSLRFRDVVADYVRAIEAGDPEIGAFLSTDFDGAMARAEQLQKDRDQGRPLGPLAGVCLAVKDNILIKNRVTTCASKAMIHFVSPYDATVIGLLKEAGAIILGKTNCDEFAMGSSTEHSAFQKTRNPRDLEKVPGGSSGGSAAAVAANFCMAALGSDTGGSIRQPAAFCGVVGFKPSYGSVSRHGLVAFSSSMDHIGPMTSHVADAARLFQVIRDQDPKDATTYKTATAMAQTKPWRFGLLEDLSGCAPEVSAVLETLYAALPEKQRVSCILPLQREVVPAYQLIANTEASSNLARFDGIRYGARHASDDLRTLYCQNRAQFFGKEVKRRILMGTWCLAAGYDHQYYLKAQEVRRQIRTHLEELFKHIDVLILPTAPTTAFPLGAHVEDPVNMYLSDRLTVFANLSGNPAISLPFHQKEGLPVGIQLIGARDRDDQLLCIAQEIETVLGQM